MRSYCWHAIVAVTLVATLSTVQGTVLPKILDGRDLTAMLHSGRMDATKFLRETMVSSPAPPSRKLEEEGDDQQEQQNQQQDENEGQEAGEDEGNDAQQEEDGQEEAQGDGKEADEQEQDADDEQGQADEQQQDDNDGEGAGQYYDYYNYENNDAYQFPYSVGGDQTIRFQKCMTFDVEDEHLDNVDEDYYLGGELRSIRSAVLFTVCDVGSNCRATESNTFISDLSVFVQSFAYYLLKEKESYCQGCQGQESFCANGSYRATSDIDLSTASFYNEGFLYQLIDCSMCDNFACESDQVFEYECDEADDDYDCEGQEQNTIYYEDPDHFDLWNGASKWLYQLSQCQQVVDNDGELVQWMGNNQYQSLMCNDDGSGIEISIFLDDKCTILNGLLDYKDTISVGDEAWYYYNSYPTLLPHMFQSSFSCFGEATVYVNIFQQLYNYDPCEVDSNSEEYYQYQQCMDTMDENPCFKAYKKHSSVDDDNYQNIQAQCNNYLEYYPCWHNPGESVIDQDACNVWKQEWRPRPSQMCQHVFNGGNFLTTSNLADCESYYYTKTGVYAYNDLNGQGSVYNQRVDSANDVKYDVEALYDENGNLAIDDTMVYCELATEHWKAGTLPLGTGSYGRRWSNAGTSADQSGVFQIYGDAKDIKKNGVQTVGILYFVLIAMGLLVASLYVIKINKKTKGSAVSEPLVEKSID